MADKATADALHRAKADRRNSTLVTGKLEELAEVLPEMVEHAGRLPDPSGWEEFAPGVGVRPATPDELLQEIRSR